ncbi:hypothetical protein JD844_005240 [Phrynosoma platyrhinos]|uniref:SMB domain-containing protein n=1 Tax=Phrynosoma platyrhinos TaxID=52577 RepID=A0ABQ7TP16_PHRPL|nr:hypothetical protein JD844_005240 [Phrynosoma platyrhinos]
MKAFWTLVAILLLPDEALVVRVSRTRRELAPGLHERGIRDAGGSYCQRHDACCNGRDDDCTVPYLDTICYCDLFCNRTVSDCCPDFWEYCLGIEPPISVQKACIRNGNKFPGGATYRDNCNLCTCHANGHWVCEDHACLINGDMIDAINRGNYGWRASNYSQLWGMTLDEGIQYRLGTIKPPTSVMNMNELQMNMDENEVLPPYFNAADKWSGMIHEPLDQGNCAGSWAFSTAAVASDRISIHSMGHMTPALSPQNLLSCNTRHQQGCNGGHLDGAWWFLRRRGKQANCQEKEIMKELMENGPVQAIMEVHEDFFMYRTGIYRHTPVAAGKPEQYRRHGTHSVKITGVCYQMFGVTKIAANSWGKDWGEHGYFRIVRGANECEIETFVVGVWGRVGMEDMHHHKK